MIGRTLISLGFILLLSLGLISCGEEEVTMPRPRGYYRIDLPEKSYQTFESACPYSFEYPKYAVMQLDSNRKGERCWANLVIPKLHATVHISYKDVKNDGGRFIEDSRNLAYKHAAKASQIEEFLIRYPEKKVYGIIYEIGGNAASSIQFHVTDSTSHFLRGSLYFYAAPNADSLAPVLSFVRKDIDHLIETLAWK
ncbi:MAG TPA: gliding motility lipoprotein GldD [Flavobacteriales bacterium]|jgi:gliding motility-associated lipoprotein GldD|nr:gliding motility lipoprotein GldD [Flavobacteriales bacterium]